MMKQNGPRYQHRAERRSYGYQTVVLFYGGGTGGQLPKAAESLAVSQPTLSVTVKKLEEELGVQLFYAFNREQHLTDEGLRLWTKAKQILDLYQETLDDMKTTNKNSSGKFTLGLSPLFGACFSAT